MTSIETKATLGTRDARANGSHSTSRVTPSDVWIVLINTLALVVGVYVLMKLGLFVSWLLVALVLALALEPPVSWLVQHGVRRGLAVLVVFVGLIALLTLVLVTVIPMLIEQGRALVTNAPQLIDRAQHWGPVRWVDQRFQIMERLETEMAGIARNIAQPALAAAAGVLRGITGTITVLVTSVFMLLFGEELLKSALRWLQPDRRDHWIDMSQRMQRVVGGYVLGTLLVASVGGLVMGITLAILGVPYFVPLGLLMIVFGLIPFLGSTIGAVLCVGTTLAAVGLQPALICLGVYLVYQQVENNLLQPVVQRRTLHMNPLVIVLALLAGTGIAGILGALLALPVAGAIQVLLEDALARREATYAHAHGPAPDQDDGTESTDR